jgi:hypothetical protein
MRYAECSVGINIDTRRTSGPAEANLVRHQRRRSALG